MDLETSFFYQRNHNLTGDTRGRQSHVQVNHNNTSSAAELVTDVLAFHLVYVKH